MIHLCCDCHQLPTPVVFLEGKDGPARCMDCAEKWIDAHPEPITGPAAYNRTGPIPVLYNFGTRRWEAE